MCDVSPHDDRPLEPEEPEELEERLEAHLKKLEEEKEKAKRTVPGLDRDVAVGKLSGQIVKALELKKVWKKLEIEREEKKQTLSGSEWRAHLSSIADAKRNIKMVVSPNAKARRRADQARSAANRKAAAEQQQQQQLPTPTAAANLLPRRP
jgi:hypothetical protein